jgi:uncharacterized delta-60 repeat protein
MLPNASFFVALRRSLWRVGSIATILSLLFFSIALAASGDLDTTFSADGMQNTDFGGSKRDTAYAVAIQPDGKIVAVGYHDTQAAAGLDFAVARYNPGGALNAAFSGDGRQTTGFGPGSADRAQAVAIQPNGKIVVAGNAGCNADFSAGCKVALARYNANGNLDTTFSGDGKQTATVGALSTQNWGGLAIQPDGKILVPAILGLSAANGTADFAVLRFNANGSLDTTFSGDGKARFGFGAGRDDGAVDLALLPNGKIVVAGWSENPTDTVCSMAVARLTGAGALDTSFSGDGKQAVNFGGVTCFLNNGGVAIDGNGRIVLAGYKADMGAGNSRIALARLTSTGALDTTFNGTGKKVTDLPGDFEAADEVRIVGTKIVVAGRGHPASTSSGPQDYALLRYNANGSLDTTFSGDGFAVFDFWGGFDVARGMAVDGNGKYVLAGQVNLNNQDDFGVMRVLP